MKTLFFNSESYEAERIVKTADSITGYDATGNQLFAFRGITDFAGFALGAGEEWDADISDTARIASQEELIKALQTEVATLKTQLKMVETAAATNATKIAAVEKTVAAAKTV